MCKKGVFQLYIFTLLILDFLHFFLAEILGRRHFGARAVDKVVQTPQTGL
jgi:hypothetical protein